MLETARSPHSVAETIDRVAAALDARGVMTFARINHAAGARLAGLELADQEVVIFGNPEVGTRLIQSEPTIGYELPLRLLAWDADGETMLGYRRPAELAAEYEVSDQSEALERMQALLDQVVAEAVAPG